MIVDKVQKSFAMNVVGPEQFQSRKFSTTIEASVPEEARQETDEGKAKFLEFADKVFNVAKALTERDALPAIKEARGEG